MSKTGLKRDNLDKYYTKIATADKCIEQFKACIDVGKFDLIIEPSAGDGAFIEGIKKIASNWRFYDILPEHSEIIKQNYFDVEIKEITKYEKIHIVGNPPFGRQSSMARKFISKSCEFCDTIALILPKSFKKESLKKTFPLNFHLIYEMDIPENSFLVEGKEHDVPCVFQVWVKKSHKRTIMDKVEPIGFKFVKKDEQHDIAFRRVGVNAGMINTKTLDASTQSHYFIKFTCTIDIDKLKNLKKTFNSGNTVGPKSISKQELIAKFNPVFEQRNH